MKSLATLKHFIFAFLIAFVLYVALYTGIERRRARNGPWRVTFSNDIGVPTLIVNEPQLHISNVKMEFHGVSAPSLYVTAVFDQAREVPFALPFGECVFMDPTFLPGTLVLKLFGHEIQLLPRVLTIDGKEYPWQSDTVIGLDHVHASAVSTNSPQSAPALQ